MSTVLGYYSNGAQLVEERHYEYIGYPDCETCHGDGFVTEESRTIWGRGKRNIQCPQCAYRFGKKDTLIARGKEIQHEVRSLMRKMRRDAGIVINARNHLDQRSFEFAENFNVNHPLAKEYRKILYRLWTWQEPSYTDAEDVSSANAK